MATLPSLSAAVPLPLPPYAKFTYNSSLREKVLEYRFLAELTTELLRRGLDFEVLRSDVDLTGYDLVVEVEGLTRHIQLKAGKNDGVRADVTLNVKLAAKPSGCVLWLLYDPATLEFTSMRWFGGLPGAPLPELGDKLARHSKGNAEGVKLERPDHRVVPVRRFETLYDFGHIADRLFGMRPQDEAAFLRSRLRPFEGPALGWVPVVAAGKFAAVPHDLAWEHSAPLAHLIDGYRIVEVAGLGHYDAFLQQQRQHAEAHGRWAGDAVTLWTTLFLEHRAWRFSGPFEPEGEALTRLDTLCRQLSAALAALA
jgi:hypothetical protein